MSWCGKWRTVNYIPRPKGLLSIKLQGCSRAGDMTSGSGIKLWSSLLALWLVVVMVGAGGCRGFSPLRENCNNPSSKKRLYTGSSNEA